MIRGILIFLVTFFFLAVASGQETQSVLLSPPSTVASAPALPTVSPLPQKILVFRKGLLFWKMEELTLWPAPVIYVRPAPKPTVIWTPSVIWR